MSTLRGDPTLQKFLRRRAQLIRQRSKTDDLIEMRTKEIQDDCTHEWTFIPGPSGNNDSEYHCSKCDKYSRRPT